MASVGPRRLPSQKKPRPTQPPVRFGPAVAVRELLSDGKWHRFEEIFYRCRDYVRPEIATRRHLHYWESRVRKDEDDTPPTGEELLAEGSRQVLRQVLGWLQARMRGRVGDAREWQLPWVKCTHCNGSGWAVNPPDGTENSRELTGNRQRWNPHATLPKLRDETTAEEE